MADGSPKGLAVTDSGKSLAVVFQRQLMDKKPLKQFIGKVNVDLIFVASSFTRSRDFRGGSYVTH